jgi:hypothetical protein
MNLETALEILSDGHTIISVKKAKEVCEFVKVPFSETLVKKFKSDPLGISKGLTMNPKYENTDGVYTLSLSCYVAEQLDVDKKAGSYLGRGSQARAYAEEIKKVLEKNEN